MLSSLSPMGFALSFTGAAFLISSAMPDSLSWTLAPIILLVCFGVFFGVV